MEPLEPPGTSSYGYEPYPYEFRHIVEELEKMAGADVNVEITDGIDGPDIVSMRGRLWLAEQITDCGPDWLSYRVGEGEHDGFRICAEKFARGQLIPGRIWLEMAPHVLTVERRHLPPKLDQAS